MQGVPQPGAVLLENRLIEPKFFPHQFDLLRGLKNEKPDTAYTLLSTIETKFRDNGFTTRRAGKEDLKRLLAIYFEQNTTTERFEDYDGQRFMEATG